MAPGRTTPAEDFIGAWRTLSALLTGSLSWLLGVIGGFINRGQPRSGVLTGIPHRRPDAPTTILQVVVFASAITPGCNTVASATRAACDPLWWQASRDILRSANNRRLDPLCRLGTHPNSCQPSGKCGADAPAISADKQAVRPEAQILANQARDLESDALATSPASPPGTGSTAASRNLADDAGQRGLAAANIPTSTPGEQKHHPPDDSGALHADVGPPLPRGVRGYAQVYQRRRRDFQIKIPPQLRSPQYFQRYPAIRRPLEPPDRGTLISRQVPLPPTAA